MKRPYEMMVIFDGTLADETITKEQNALQALIEQHAEFEKADVWGRRDLAFTIKKKRTGVYVLFLYVGETATNLKIDHALRLNERVLRFLITHRQDVQPRQPLSEQQMGDDE